MLLRALLILILLSAFGTSALADPGTPVPLSRKEGLADLQSRLAQEKSRAGEIDAKADAAGKELADSRKSLVSAARRVRDAEKRLGGIEDKIASLKTEQTDIESHVEKDRSTVAALILALERLHRVPPESLMLRPGAPVDAARSAMLMQGILPPLQERADSLKKDLARLEILRADLDREHEKAQAEAQDLKNRHAEMAALLNEREKLYGKARREQVRQQETLRRISAQARSLQDLLAKLEENRKKQEKEEQEQIRTTALLRRAPDVQMPASGNATLPVSGIVKVHYGENDSLGAKSKGVSIDGMPGGVVVAPMGGIVRYAGPFRSFGNIIILEHEKGLHSLVAGLGKIDTVEGREVTAGEPVGALPGTAKGKRPTLYYELRQGGKPINPSRKFADLG